MRIFFMLTLIGFAGMATPSFAVDLRGKTAMQSFSLTTAPSAADWRYLQHASNSELGALWAFHQGRGKTLKDWSWQWRIGWLKVCGRVKTAFCDEILRQGMNDHAMVVRAEAATSLGEKYAGSRDKGAMDQLARAFQERKNARNGKPLLVLYRILFALNQIGGTQSDDVGKNLALGYPQTSRYWTILSSNRF